MAKYFLHIGYKGTKYHGWQCQVKVISVQEVLEKALSKMMKQPLKCHPCGRTDSGVHANQFFAHLILDQEIDFDFVFRINKMLPDDIAVFDLIPVQSKANAQLDAISRTYDYFMHFDKNPFLSDLSALYQIKNLDIENMQKATALLHQYKDFHAFCLRPNTHNHTICEVMHSHLSLDASGSFLHFQITASRFLQGMIRIIVARLIDLGCQKISLNAFEDALQNRTSFSYKNLAQPKGLYLSKVVYPYLDLPTNPLFMQQLHHQKWAI